ncbi:MAG: DUF2157 domain-containing protein [Planctomycetota bacterium]
MNSHIRWLHEELARWEQSGAIDQTVADRIRAIYPTPRKALPWGAIVFSSLGATIFGLGVILFFAYNWATMPKFAKLSLVFVTLALAHGFAFRLRRKVGGHPELGEALHVLGTMLFGAGIWLVGQIYHLDEHYPDAFLAWGGAALCLAWALPSLSHGVIATILFALWSGFETIEFRNTAHTPPWIILLGIGPLAWSLRSKVLLIATIISFQVTLAFAVSKIDDALILPVLTCTASCFIAMGQLIRFHPIEPFRPGHFTLLASVFFWGMLYALTFADVSEDLLDPITIDDRSRVGLVYFGVVAVGAVVLWSLALLKGAGEQRRTNGLRLDHLVVPVALVMMLSSWVGLGWGAAGDGLTGAICFNVIYIIAALALLISGCQRVEVGRVAAGCVLFAILAVTRYVDLFDSLIARSLVFLAVGAGIFAIGIVYSKAKKKRQQQTPTTGLPA